jgi:hypothetical protein
MSDVREFGAVCRKWAHVRAVGGVTLALAAALFGAGCGSGAGEGIAPTVRLGGPRVVFDLGERPLPNVPLPNDLATRFDATSPTGRRLNVGLAARTRWESHLREAFDELDGFGVYAPLSVAFTEPLDLQAIRARYANDDFRDDPVFVINVDPTCSRFGEEVAVDVDRKLFPVILKEHGKPTTDPKRIGDGNRLFEFDPKGAYTNLFFEEQNEDKNGNGLLDPGEDLDDDGELDVANLDDPKACDGLEMGSTERDRCIADHLLTWYERASNTLILRPVWPLEERCTYAVALTKRLVGASGKPVESPFPYVNHRDQSKALERLPGLLARYGLGREDLAYAWSFTTGTQTRPLQLLREGLHGEGPWSRLAKEFPVESFTPLKAVMDDGSSRNVAPGACLGQAVNEFWFKAINGTGEFPPNMCAFAADNASIGGLVVGSFKTPNFMVNKDGRPTDLKRNDDDERFHIDAERGTGTYGTQDATFWCALPAPKPGVACTPGNPEGKPFCQPYPMSIYAHGYGGSRAEVTSYFGRLTQMGTAACAIDLHSHGGRAVRRAAAPLLSVIKGFRVKNMVDLFFEGRDRDINDDGREDPGADYYVADVSHSRDNLRQAALDISQMVRIFRSMDGARKATDGSVFGDLDGDGAPDMGGTRGTISVWGISLGGLVSGIVGGLEPDVDATLPISGGAGLVDIAARATVSGLPAAVFLPVVGPFVAGYRSSENGELFPDGELELGFLVGDLTQRKRVDFGRVRGIAPGDRVELINVDKGVSQHVTVGPRGVFRVAVAADALTPYERRGMLGLDEVEGGAPVEVDDPTRFGDRLALRVYDAQGKRKSVTDVATGQELAEVTSFLKRAEFQSTAYRPGQRLVAVQRGLGYQRNSREFRRMFGLAQHALDGADSAVWSRYYHEQPRPGVRLAVPPRENHVLVMPTSGDMVVPVNTAIASARTAGLFGSFLRDESVPAEHGWRKLFVPDPRYGKSIDRWLVENHVIENMPRFGRQTANANNHKVVYDVDDMSGGRVRYPCEGNVVALETFPCEEGTPPNSTFGIPRPSVPLRASRTKADGGFDGMRIPLLDPTDRHGVWNSQMVRLFDSDSHTMNAIGLYMRTRGKTFDLDPSCACSAALTPRFFLDGAEKLYTSDPTCANDAQKTRINLCNAACVQTLDLYTVPEVRCP